MIWLHYRKDQPVRGIALSGALAVLTSLTISRLTGSLDRKWLLLGLTALMAASGVTPLASSFPVYICWSRALIGIIIGGFGRCRRQRLFPAGAATPVPAHWPSLTAATRAGFHRCIGAAGQHYQGHRRLARRLLCSCPAGGAGLRLAMH